MSSLFHPEAGDFNVAPGIARGTYEHGPVPYKGTSTFRLDSRNNGRGDSLAGNGPLPGDAGPRVALRLTLGYDVLPRQGKYKVASRRA